MTDKDNVPVETGEGSNNTDYIAALKQLKENSVDREKYDQLLAERKQLIENFVNNREAAPETDVPKKSLEELRENFRKEDKTNLDYISDALALRDALIERGEPDPFTPFGRQIVPTDEDVSTANKVATVLQECVDYAQGDPAVFNTELQRRLVDVKFR